MASRSTVVPTVLSRVTEADLWLQPYPHVAIADAIDPELCRQLIDEFPPLRTVTGGAEPVPLERYSYSARRVFQDPQVSELWRNFIAAHTSQEFLDQVVRVFQPALQTRNPDYAGRPLTAGLREVDKHADFDVLLDAQICINGPGPSEGEIKLPHVDRRQVLFAGLFYLRIPNDDSTGGDLEIFRFSTPTPAGFRDQYVDREYVEVVKTVPYRSNMLVLFLNGIDSVHGVTPRSAASEPRCFMNLVGEVVRHQFDWDDYQLEPKAPRAAAPAPAPTLAQRATGKAKALARRTLRR